jgi:hypothetical protein
MTEKIVELRRRRGIWLYSYDQIKTRTPFYWFASSLLGSLAFFGGSVVAWLMWSSSSDLPLAGRLFRMIIPMAMISYGILEFPPGIIYLFRRRHHQPVDIWDYETPEDQAVKERVHKPERS